VPTAGVDFFRVDRARSVKLLLAVAITLVLVGSTSIGAHLVSRVDEGLAHLISLVGGTMLLAGLVLGFGAMAMLLFENVYLVIQEAGLLMHDNGKETQIPWSDLESVKVDAGYVVLERKEAETVRWFAGKAAKDISAKVDDARRKALHGLLKASS
jgi:hypothetical protein